VNPQNPTQPPWIPEETKPTGTPRYLYSHHKAEVDRIVQDFIERHPDVQVTLLRGAIVLGPHTQNIVSKMMDWPWRSFPWMFQVRGADPPFQFLSEEDTCEILLRALTPDKAGIFNCAGDGVIPYSQVMRAEGKRPLALPAAVLYPLTHLLWKLRLSPFPAGILDLIRYPWVGDNAHLKTAFGYAPQHTSRQALESFLAARRAR
jgi:UDP-glucose 4-epimerase